MGIMDYLTGPKGQNAIGALGQTLMALDSGQAPNLQPFYAQRAQIDRQDKMRGLGDMLMQGNLGLNPQQQSMMGGIMEAAPEMGMGYLMQKAFPAPQAMTDQQRLFEMIKPENRQSAARVQLGLDARAQPPQGLTSLQQRAVDAGLRPGTEAWKQFMLAGGVEKGTETVFGPDGQPVFHRGPAGSAPKPLREFEARALQFNERMQQSLPRVMAAEEAVMQKGGPSVWDNAMESFGSLGNFLKTEEGQAYKAAALEWIAGLLRLDSGAAVPESEFERYFKTYFFVPGDSDQTRQNKAASRVTVMDALGRIAPPGNAGAAPQQASPRKPLSEMSLEELQAKRREMAGQ